MVSSKALRVKKEGVDTREVLVLMDLRGKPGMLALRVQEEDKVCRG